MHRSCFRMAALVLLVFLASQCPVSGQGPVPRITTLAGTGVPGLTGDKGQATSARLDTSYGVAVDSANNVYISDSWNHCVRQVALDGTIRTIAGTGAAGFSGDGGQAQAARLFLPRGLALDSQGNLYIADSGNACIRKVDRNGIISTFAGMRAQGFAGDGLNATLAELNDPRGLAFDSKGNLYVADSLNYRIRKIVPSGIITTMAGNGSYGAPQDGVLAVNSSLGMVQGLAFDSGGNLYFSDSLNHVVCRITPDGMLRVLAGQSGFGPAGDQGPANAAQLEFPKGLATDSQGNVYFADALNHRVRVISPNGSIRTVAGSGVAGVGGDGVPAVATSLNSPYDLAFDSQGNLYIADAWNHRIRKVEGLLAPAPSAISIRASPNPIPVSGPAIGQTTISWNAPGYSSVQVRVNRPDGPEMAQDGSTGSAKSGLWVVDGTRFFLVDSATGKPLASVTAFVVAGVSISASPNPIPVPAGSGVGQTTILWDAPGYDKVEVHVEAPSGPTLATGGWTGAAQTSVWVVDGMRFFLVDTVTGKTLASVTVHLKAP